MYLHLYTIYEVQSDSYRRLDTQHAAHSLCMQWHISTWYMEVWPVGSSMKSTCCLSLQITLGEGCLLTQCDNGLCTCTGIEEVVFC